MPRQTDARPFTEMTRALGERLARPLPGRRAMKPLTASHRPFVPIDRARAEGCREAGTLALIYPRDESAHIVLTLRPATLADHAGQVSLPGGRLENGENALAAALREAAEELGVGSAGLAVLGALTPLYIPPTGYCVSPFVAATDRRPDFAPEAGEVEDVIEVRLDDLDLAHRRTESWEIRGERRRVPFYDVAGYKIWGATAMILAELAETWRDAAAEVDRARHAAAAHPSPRGDDGAIGADRRT